MLIRRFTSVLLGSFESVGAIVGQVKNIHFENADEDIIKTSCLLDLQKIVSQQERASAEITFDPSSTLEITVDDVPNGNYLLKIFSDISSQQFVLVKIAP
jgi:hypothetical protein